MLNNPISAGDPSGHYCVGDMEGCASEPGKGPGLSSSGGGGGGGGDDDDDQCKNNDPDCELGRGHGDGGTGPVDPVLWSTANYGNQNVGNYLAWLSTKLQYAAGFFSYLGGAAEIGLAIIGAVFGGAALSWLDGLVPIGDFAGGYVGLRKGWTVGHAIHTLFTNRIESALSDASARATYASDIFLGNTRFDLYRDRGVLVLGQPSATNGALALIGRASTSGIADAIIDDIGMRYSNGELGGGVFDMFGVTGNQIPFISKNGSSWLSLQLGDN